MIKNYLHVCPNCHEQTTSNEPESKPCRECGADTEVRPNRQGVRPSPRDPRNVFTDEAQRRHRPL